MGNVVAFITGCALLAGIVSILMATSPRVRLERACTPVTWVGKAATSVVMLTDASENGAASTQRWFESLNYSCQFALWRQFYEESWRQEQVRLREEEERLQEEARRQQTPAPQRRMVDPKGGQ